LKQYSLEKNKIQANNDKKKEKKFVIWIRKDIFNIADSRGFYLKTVIFWTYEKR